MQSRGFFKGFAIGAVVSALAATGAAVLHPLSQEPKIEPVDEIPKPETKTPVGEAELQPTAMESAGDPGTPATSKDAGSVQDGTTESSAVEDNTPATNGVTFQESGVLEDTNVLEQPNQDSGAERDDTPKAEETTLPEAATNATPQAEEDVVQNTAAENSSQAQTEPQTPTTQAGADRTVSEVNRQIEPEMTGTQLSPEEILSKPDNGTGAQAETDQIQTGQVNTTTVADPGPLPREDNPATAQ